MTSVPTSEAIEFVRHGSGGAPQADAHIPGSGPVHMERESRYVRDYDSPAGSRVERRVVAFTYEGQGCNTVRRPVALSALPADLAWELYFTNEA